MTNPPPVSASASAPAPASSSRTSTGPTSTRKPPTNSTSTSSTGSRMAAGGTGAASGASLALRQEIESLKEMVAGLEKERDFYFSKLRDIELLVQTATDQDPELDKDENGLVKNIQNILYSTEEGFEIPTEAGDFDGDGHAGEGEQETF